MSNDKPAWWSYVKNIVRQYPELRKELNETLDPQITSKLSITGGFGSGETSSPVEQCVIHGLPPKKQIKYDAVENAIYKTMGYHPRDYTQRLKIIDLVYWKKTHTIAGASLKIPCHTNTGGLWQAEFIRLVADELDLP